MGDTADAKDISRVGDLPEHNDGLVTKEALEQEFGLKEPHDLNQDPIQPGRKRLLFLACACILGTSSVSHAFATT